MQVSYIEQVIKTTIFLENESFFMQQLYSIPKYTVNCSGSGVILKTHLQEGKKEKKKRERSKSHLTAVEGNSLDQLVINSPNRLFMV